MERGDELPQDGMGREAAHGPDEDNHTQGGSVGRRTMGNAGDDLLGIDAGGVSTPRDADGRGAENARRDVPRDPNEQAVNDAFEGRGAADRESGDPAGVDLDAGTGGTRRDPTR